LQDKWTLWDTEHGNLGVTLEKTPTASHPTGNLKANTPISDFQLTVGVSYKL